MRDLLGYRVVLGTSSAPEHKGPKSCSSWPSAEAFRRHAGRTRGVGTRAPFCLHLFVSSALTKARGRCLQPPQLVEEGAAAGGAAGVPQGSVGRLIRASLRAAVPSTLHAARPGPRSPGWKDRCLLS